MRGNRRHHQGRRTRLGPIPACAGQPQQIAERLCRCGAYPRVCGATSTAWRVTSKWKGLSPRVRGNPAALSSCAKSWGPIPACAGQPLSAEALVGRAGAYPRVCGATAISFQGNLRSMGLSPRVRGNQGRQDLSPDRQWPIPACAGQPSMTRWSASRTGAYPRVCGATSCS